MTAEIENVIRERAGLPLKSATSNLRAVPNGDESGAPARKGKKGAAPAKPAVEEAAAPEPVAENGGSAAAYAQPSLVATDEHAEQG